MSCTHFNIQFFGFDWVFSFLTIWWPFLLHSLVKMPAIFTSLYLTYKNKKMLLLNMYFLWTFAYRIQECSSVENPHRQNWTLCTGKFQKICGQDSQFLALCASWMYHCVPRISGQDYSWTSHRSLEGLYSYLEPIGTLGWVIHWNTTLDQAGILQLLSNQNHSQSSALDQTQQQ